MRTSFLAISAVLCCSSSSHGFVDSGKSTELASVIKDMRVTINGQKISGDEFENRFIITHKFIPELHRFVVNKDYEGSGKQKRHHRRSRSQPASTRVTRSYIRCEVCGRTFSTWRSAYVHAEETGHRDWYAERY